MRSTTKSFANECTH